MKKLTLCGVVAVFLFGCDSDPVESLAGSGSAYTKCEITDSGALLAKDRARDVRQCWDNFSVKDQNEALQHCHHLASAYIASQYVVGHSFKIQVSTDATCH
ncbi:MAG: hypothetical protein CR974_00200 [Gammaproteobacteria bacterium]|nr:MAG: hypothetical protein CR974_00200 [Gammaproteobacteria bacterium]